MAGKPGRSGGSNRRTVREHHLNDTFRPDRVTSRPSAAAQGLEPPAHLGPEQCAVWTELATRYVADPLRFEILAPAIVVFRRLAQVSEMTPPELRAFRQAASLVNTVAAGLKLADAEADSAADDPFAEFDDNPLQKYLGPARETRG